MQMGFLSLLLTFAVAAAGALIFLKLKVPAGAILGAMIFVAVYNTATGAAYFPMELRPVIRVLAGALIGARVSKDDAKRMKDVIYPGLLLVFGMLLMNLVLGYSIHRLTGLELMTALFGSTPGGVQDMALIADEFGADAAQVAILQTVRVLAVISIMPSIMRFIGRKYLRTHPYEKTEIAAELEPATPQAPGAASAATPERGSPDEPATPQAPGAASVATTGRGSPDEQDPKSVARGNAFSFIRTLISAGIGGFLLNMTAIPAGAMIGGMAGTIAASMLIKPSYVPVKMRIVIQTLAGMLIGSGIGMEEIIGIKNIIVPAAILVVVLFVANLLFGWLIHRLTKLDLITSLFASAAGGLADMAIIADEMGADAPKVAIIHLMRFVCVIVLFPMAIRIFSSML